MAVNMFLLLSPRLGFCFQLHVFVCRRETFRIDWQCNVNFKAKGIL